MIQHILHLDMDAFFAAVEVMDHPKWEGKPLVVGSPPDKRGVVSTASYEARKFGIHSAMPSRTAYKLCPQAIFVPVRMKRYMDVSEKVMQVIQSFTPMIEQVSVDEAFMDISGVLRKWKSPELLARELKARIKKDIGLTASVGIANNKFLAKLASDFHKPDGLTIIPVEADEIRKFLAPLPVSRIWGVGKVTEQVLHQAGFRRIEDLQMVSVQTLVPIVGPALADHIGKLAHGIDDRPLVTESEAKSISAEHTFDEDEKEIGVVRQQLVGLVEQVGRRLRRTECAASTIFIKIRFEDFQTMSRQETLARPICSDRRLLDIAVSLFDRQKLDQPVRLIGFGVSGLIPQDEYQPQLEMFLDPAREKETRDGKLDRVVDDIKEKLGSHSIRRASSMGTDDRN